MKREKTQKDAIMIEKENVELKKQIISLKNDIDKKYGRKD
jgi:hypothetical protein